MRRTVWGTETCYSCMAFLVAPGPRASNCATYSIRQKQLCDVSRAKNNNRNVYTTCTINVLTKQHSHERHEIQNTSTMSQQCIYIWHLKHAQLLVIIHTPLFPGLPGSAGTRKVKPIWILQKQETVSGSGIRWAICKSAPHSRQITTPAHHTQFFTGRMPLLPPNQQHQRTEGTGYKQHRKIASRYTNQLSFTFFEIQNK